jgi:hypothetical protein
MNTSAVSRRVRLGGIVAVPITAAMLAFAAVAFACTPQATIKLSPTSGPAGTTVTVTGNNMTNDATVKLFWGGISGQLLSTTTVKNGTVTMSFKVPDSASNGQTIVAANQVLNGAALGSPANALFNVNTPNGTAPAPAVVPVEDTTSNPVNANGAAGLADAPAAAPESAVAPVAAPVAPAPRIRTAPAETAAASRAPARASTPVAAATPAAQTPPPPSAETPAPAPVAAPAPAPVPEAAPATAPARRSVMVSMASDDTGSPALAIALVGIGLVLALGASAVVLAGRRDRKAPAKAAKR